MLLFRGAPAKLGGITYMECLLTVVYYYLGLTEWIILFYFILFIAKDYGAKQQYYKKEIILLFGSGGLCYLSGGPH